MLEQIYNTDKSCDRIKIKTLFYIPLFNFIKNLVQICLLLATLYFRNIAEPPRVTVLNGNETSYRVTNLESGKNYKITVTAGFDGGSSPPAQYQFRSFSSLTIDETNRGKCLLQCSRAHLGSMKGRCLRAVMSKIIQKHFRDKICKSNKKITEIVTIFCSLFGLLNFFLIGSAFLKSGEIIQLII